MEKPAGILQLVFRTKNQLRNVFWKTELRGSKEDSFSLNKKWIQRYPIELKSDTSKYRFSLSISNPYMLISPKTRWPKTRLIEYSYCQLRIRCPPPEIETPRHDALVGWAHEVREWAADLARSGSKARAQRIYSAGSSSALVCSGRALSRVATQRGGRLMKAEVCSFAGELAIMRYAAPL